MRSRRFVLFTLLAVGLGGVSAFGAGAIVTDKLTYSFTLSVPGTKEKAKVVVRGNDLTVNGKKIEPKVWPNETRSPVRRAHLKTVTITLDKGTLLLDPTAHNKDTEPVFVWVQGPLTVSGLKKVATMRGRPLLRSGPLRLEDGPVTYDYYYSVRLGKSKSFLLLDQSGPSPKRIPQTLRDAINTLEVRYEK